MLRTLKVAARDRARLAEIAAIGSRYGLDVLLDRIGSGEQGATGEALPHRTRLALEALGPTFIKLGQILATRADLLPPEWIGEFEALQSNAPVLPFDTLRAAVEEALGEPPETAFARFDPVPLAAASIAQVHRATLHDGREVVLKIRRPGIRRLMESDLRLLAEIAILAESSHAEARRARPVAMVRQLTALLLEELDFTNEGRNADRLRADFAGDARLVIPDIHWSYSSEALLVMDFVAGVAPTDGAALRAAGIDPGAIAATGADIVLDMVLLNGRFHGDPHPGNLLCLPGDRIALLDLGLVGQISARRRQEFVAFIQSITADDAAALADVLTGWADGADLPVESIRAASERLLARHGAQPLVLSLMVADFLPLMREYRLPIPPDLVLVLKALVTIDGVLARIAPGFDLTAAVRRASRRIVAARLSPAHWQPLAAALAWEIMRIGDDAPRLLRAAIRRLEADDRATPPAASPETTRTLRNAANRIALAIVAAALAISTALLAAGRV